MSDSSTIVRLQGLQNLYAQGFQSAFIDRAIQQVIATEADNIEAELRYHMTSADFYSRFRTSELGADIDVVEWSIFYDLYQGVQKRLHELHTLL